MGSQHPNPPQRLSVNDSTISTRDESKLKAFLPPSSDISLARRREHINKLLTLDLKQHEGNADKLYKISVDLQTLSQELQTKIKELEAMKTSELTKAPTRGSRSQTDDSELSRKQRSLREQEGTAVVFSPSDNGLTVRQKRSMNDADYIEAKLPRFHWFSDRLYIYFEKRSYSDFSSPGKPTVFVLKKELGPSSTRDATLIRTVRLGQLGIRIKLRRLFGQIKVIYILSPRAQASHATEMTTYNVHGGDQAKFNRSAATTEVEPSSQTATIPSPVAQSSM